MEQPTNMQIDVSTTHGTSPNPAGIGKAGRTLVWAFKGNGSVTNVQIQDPGSYFSNFRQTGAVYLVDYAGSSGSLTWNYTASATWNPTGDFGGELTNGGP